MSSPYGKACKTCTKAKVRCTYAGDKGPCERCTRLSKECEPAQRTRLVKTKAGVDRQNALEAKVDNLVELLKRNQAIPQEEAPRQNAVKRVREMCDDTFSLPKSPLCSLTVQAAKEMRGSAPLSGTQTAETSEASTSSTYTTPSAYTPDPGPETEEDLQYVLDTYRTSMFVWFPVVALAPDTTVEEMATERPHVWLVLRTICSRNLTRQLALADETKRALAKEFVVDGVRSFDLLCALILYANWAPYFSFKANQSLIIHMAIAAAGDLGLSRPAMQSSPTVMLNWTTQGCPKPPHALTVKPRTMEERRVVLGLFFISSIVSDFFQRAEPMRWSNYLNESLELLGETKELPSDELLYYLIRAQLICNSLRNDGWHSMYHSSTERIPRAQHMHLHRMQLDDLKRSIPSHIKENATLRLHILDMEVTLYEYYVTPPPSSSQIDQIQRTEGLWACFSAVKSYFDIFFNLDPTSYLKYLYISVNVYAGFGHCLVALFRISTLELPDAFWNRQHVISELDVGDVMRKWSHILEAAPQALGLEKMTSSGSESLFEHYRKTFSITVLKWWETKIRPSIMKPEQPPQKESEQLQTSIPGDLPAGDTDFAAMDMDLDDESWMRDMLNSGFDFRGF